jgi:hypothetical protein
LQGIRAVPTVETSAPAPIQKHAAVEMVNDMSKAQKRGNREIKKQKAVKKVEQPIPSSSTIKTPFASAGQPKKKP